MSARTVWEEGHHSGARVTLVAAAVSLALAILTGAIYGRLNPVFDLGFVAVSLWAAFAVRQRDFFRAGVLPPFLMLGLFVVNAIVHRGWIAQPQDSIV